MKCIEATSTSIAEIGDGDSEINLPKLGVFNINGLRVLRNGASSPIEADLRIIESNVTGFQGMKASRAKGFGKDLRGPHSLTFKSKKATLIGTYTVEGHGRILKFKGGGPCNITFIKPVIVISFKGEPEVKDGKTYMKVVDFKVDLSIKRFAMKFEKLFKDQAITDNANFFLNEYGQDFYNEFKDVLDKEMAVIFKKVVADVLEFVPYEDLFLKDGDEVQASE